MKFSIGQAELANAVALAGQSVSGKSTLPVLANVLLAANAGDGSLTVTGTNLETALSVVVAAEIDEGGSLTLPAKLLRDALAGIPNEARVEIVQDMARMAAVITFYVGGKRRGQATVKGIDAAEYPMIPDGTGAGVALTFTGADLANIIKQSAFSAADGNETSRPALTGVLLTSNGDGLTAAATDGYRLSVVRRPNAEPLPTAIVPARALDLADKLAAASETVDVRTVDNRLTFCFFGGRAWREARLVCQTIDAKFPDYTAIIPKQSTTQVRIDTGELLRALKMAALFAADSSDRILLTVKPALFEDAGRLMIAAQSVQTGNFDTDLEAAVEGGALTAAFNVQYLLQGITALAEPTARLEFTKADRPGVVLGANFQYVIMPMALQVDELTHA